MDVFNQKKSLMTLPAELRLSILDFALQGIIYIFYDKASTLTSVRDCFLADVAVIWVSRLLRYEALPLLRRHLKVYWFENAPAPCFVPLPVRQTAANVHTYGYMEISMRDSRPWVPGDYLDILRSRIPGLRTVYESPRQLLWEAESAEQLLHLFQGRSERSSFNDYLHRVGLTPAPLDEDQAGRSLNILFRFVVRYQNTF